MQILPNGLVQLQNSKTGETKIVKPDDLPQYGAKVFDQYLSQMQQPQQAAQAPTPQAQPQAPAQPGLAVQTATGRADAPAPQPDLATSIGGFLGNIINSSTNQMQNLASGKTIRDFTDRQNQRSQQNPVKPGDIGGALKSAAQDTLDLILSAAKPAAQAASFMTPFGKGAGIAQKVLLPGAITGGLQGASEDNATPQSVAGNAVLGAGGAGVLHGVLGIGPAALKGAGAGLENAADAIVKSQYNVPSEMADKLGLGKTIDQLGQYGFKSISDVSKAAPQVTGDSGLITQLTRDAVNKAGPVPFGEIQTAPGVPGIPGVLDQTKQLLSQESLISKDTETKFLGRMNKFIYNSKGDPGSVFKEIQTLGSQMAGLGHSDEAQALKRVYAGVQGELENRLYKEAGADNVLASSVITPEVIAKANQISPQLGDQLSKVQNVRDLRSLASPFVRGSQLVRATQSRADNALVSKKDAIGASVGGVLGLLGGGGVGAVPGAVGGLALEKAMTSDKGLSVISGLLGGAGKTASSVGNATQISSPILQQILGQAGARTGMSVPGALVQGPDQPINQPTDRSENQSSNQINTPPSNGSVAQPNNSSQNSGRITPQMVQNAHLYLPPFQADKIQKAYEAQYGGAGNVENPAEVKNLNNQIDNLIGTFNKMNPVQKLNPYDPTNQALQAQRAAITLEIVRSSAGRVSQAELDAALKNFLSPTTTNARAQGEALKALVNNKQP